MANYINGVDVSRWQGTNIDWNKAKAAGNLFSFIKASEGTAYSRKFIDMGIKQATDAKTAGLKTGYYHFAHPTGSNGVATDAKAEARFFIKTVKLFPKCNFPLVLDFEDENSKLSPAEAEAWIKQFGAVLGAAGFEMILYSYANYLNKTLPENHTLGGLPLWLAYYPRVFDKNKPPKNPRGWSGWVTWQYSEKGKPAGFTSSVCDLNIMQQDFFNKY
jgi:lysozyme